jgi:predicted peroxiredoxin
VNEDHDLLVLLAHGTDEPAFAAHAIHLAAAAAALGNSVGIYLAVKGTTWLSETAPQDVAAELEELRAMGVAVYACPRSLAENDVTPKVGAYRPLGATAAVRLARRAGTTLSL